MLKVTMRVSDKVQFVTQSTGADINIAEITEMLESGKIKSFHLELATEEEINKHKQALLS